MERGPSTHKRLDRTWIKAGGHGGMLKSRLMAEKSTMNGIGNILPAQGGGKDGLQSQGIRH